MIERLIQKYYNINFTGVKKIIGNWIYLQENDNGQLITWRISINAKSVHKVEYVCEGWNF